VPAAGSFPGPDSAGGSVLFPRPGSFRASCLDEWTVDSTPSSVDRENKPFSHRPSGGESGGFRKRSTS
jgi:hypothetical protein